MKKSLTLIPVGVALAAAIVAGTSFAAASNGVPTNAPAAAFADGPDLPLPPPGFGPRGEHGPRGGHFGGPGFGGAGFFGGERGGVMRELHGLNLSDAQEDAIDDVFVKHHKEQRELFKRGRDLHKAYRELDPLAKDYVAQSGKLADQAAGLTRDAIKLHATVQSEVLSKLTPEQTQKLKTELADKKAKREERLADRRDGHGPRGPRGPQPDAQ